MQNVKSVNSSNLFVYADPLGDLYIEWKIPFDIIYSDLVFVLPTYKYEMSYLLGVPVPFSSLAEDIETEVFNVFVLDKLSIEINYITKKEFKGYKNLVIENYQLKDEAFKNEILVVQFVIRKLVNKDKIFFNFVFTLMSPLAGDIVTDIHITAKFSFDINSYKFKTFLIDDETGGITKDIDILKHKKVGDYIYGDGENLTINNNGNIDLHIHASRLPFMIDRRLFWICIFIWIFLGVSGLFSLIKHI